MKVQMANYSLACRTCYKVVSATKLHVFKILPLNCQTDERCNGKWMT